MFRRSLIVCLTLATFAATGVWALSYRRSQTPQGEVHRAFLKDKDWAYLQWMMRYRHVVVTALDPRGLAARLELTEEHRIYLSAHRGTFSLAYAMPSDYDDVWRPASHAILGFRIARYRPDRIPTRGCCWYPQPDTPEYEEAVRWARSADADIQTCTIPLPLTSILFAVYPALALFVYVRGPFRRRRRLRKGLW